MRLYFFNSKKQYFSIKYENMLISVCLAMLYITHVCEGINIDKKIGEAKKSSYNSIFFLRSNC